MCVTILILGFFSEMIQVDEHKVLLAARINIEGEFAWPDGTLIGDR